MVRRNLVLIPALVLALVSSAGAQDPLSSYRKVHKIAIGGEGGWDFLEVEPVARRLYVTRGTRVVVVNLDSEKVIGEIADTPGVHGVAFAPDLGRGFTSNGRDSSVTVFDTKTLKIFVNLEDKSEIVEFDARTLKVLNHFPLAPGEEPTGLAFDREHRRLFSTCANQKLVVMDADSGKVIQALKIGPGPDGCIFDAERGLVFSSNGGDGTLSIIRAKSQDQYEVAETIKTQVSAKTIAMDPKTHRLYLSAATPEAPAAGKTTKKAGGGRRYAPDSFVVLVVGD